MAKKMPSVQSLKAGFTLFFIIGLLLCFWMENSVGAFIVLLVGAIVGGLARDVKYAESSPHPLTPSPKGEGERYVPRASRKSPDEDWQEYRDCYNDDALHNIPQKPRKR